MLDLSDVTFMDGASPSALVRARNPADQRGVRLVPRGTDPAVLRLLKLTGLDQRLRAERPPA